MARSIDANGWLQVADNPITKAGVFPYLGSEIPGAPEHDRIYRVYRPAEELQKPETLASFRLIPFIDDHAPLGSKGMPAEKKGIQGMIGEQVYYDHPYIRANIKVLSDSAMAKIGSGKIQLSPGYSCKYDFTPGVFDGETYDAIQHTIRGNHLALVDEGRTGPDVAMQDKKPDQLRSGDIITVDTAELLPMEFTPEQLEQIRALIAEIIAAQSTGDETPGEEKGLADDQEITEEVVSAEQGAAAEVANTAAEVAAEKIAEAEEVLTEVSEAVEAVEIASEEVVQAADAKSRKIAMDKMTLAKQKLTKAKEKQSRMTLDSSAKLMLNTIEKLQKQISELKKPVAMDTAGLFAQIGKRDELASRLSPFIGTFDYKSMTLDAVAKYGADKLGIKVPGGSEQIALDAWLHGRKPERDSIIAADSAISGDAFKSWENK